VGVTTDKFKMSNRAKFLTCKPGRKLILLIVLILVTIGSGILVWEELLKESFIPKRWGVVEDGKIYRSGQLSAALVKKTLEKYNIAVVIDLTGEVSGDKDQEAEKQATQELGIEVYRYPLKGNGTGDIKNYANAIATIVDARRNGKPVLVHCAAGTQRTGGVIACYRMLVEGKPPSQAYAELLRYDWHDEQDQVLLKYINTNMIELANLLLESGVIDQLPEPLPVIRSKYESVGSSYNSDIKSYKNSSWVVKSGLEAVERICCM
jgi:protein-tyrosine phosphatase